MNIKNKKTLKLLFFWVFTASIGIILLFQTTGLTWTYWNFSILDYFHKYVVAHDAKLKKSDRIVLVTINDNTYKYMKDNGLSYFDLITKVNYSLAELAPQAVGYDLIFNRGTIGDNLEKLTNSVANLNCAYLPSAIQMQQRLTKLNKAWEKSHNVRLKCRIGVNTGVAIIGNLGSEQVSDYTAIGDNVNLASRLESANKQYQTQIMISETTFKQLSHDFFNCRLLDFVKVKGKSLPVKIYEVYGYKNGLLEDRDQKYYIEYKNGIEAYLTKNFILAIKCFSNALEIHPNDLAANNFLQKSKLIDPQSLAHDWDGSSNLIQK